MAIRLHQKVWIVFRGFQRCRSSAQIDARGRVLPEPLRRALIFFEDSCSAFYSSNALNVNGSFFRAAFSGAKERNAIWLLCGLAAIHVFIFSAAFPFFNIMDEDYHFDLVLKYSHAHLPQGMEMMSEETARYTRDYSSPEYRGPPGAFPGGRFPPPHWTRNPGDGAAQMPDLWMQVRDPGDWPNYESSQQPLYYALAGFWCRMGFRLGLAGLRLLYWVRFLNIFFVAATVWVAYLAGRLIFPENAFVRLGVPALVAFMPQQAFYSIQNDVLSPLCFGVAFVCLARGASAEVPSVKLGIVAGLALASTFLTKMSNVPLLAVVAMAILFKAWQWHRTGKMRVALPALAWLIVCAVVPVAVWLAWTKYAFGDFSGTAAKLQTIGWTAKPASEWLQHPIFSIHGFITFLSGLIVAFWQGEFIWHATPLDLPAVNAVYFVFTVAFVALGAAGLLSRSARATGLQRQMLWLGFGGLLAGAFFLAFLSIRFDFGPCREPSRDHPYFVAGRLLLGALIPFLSLILFGLHYLLRDLKSKIVLPLTLAGMVLFMLVSEIVTDWPVFGSAYNWYHF